MARVSNIRFCADDGNVLAREGAYTKQPAQTEAAAAPAQEKKKSSTGKKILYTVLGLAAVAAGLAALKRFDVLKVLPKADLEKAKWYQPKVAGHYLAQAGEAVAKYCWDIPSNFVKGLFKGGKTPDAGGAA